MVPVKTIALILALAPAAAAEVRDASPAGQVPPPPPALTARANTPDLAQQAWQAYEQGDFPAALAAFQQLLQTAPSDATLWYNAGCLQALLKDPAAARSSLARALRLNPYLAAAHDALGQLAEQQGDLEEAWVGYRNGVAIEPEEPKYLWHLGRIQLKRNRPVDARQELWRLLMADPAHVPARYALGVLDLRAEQPDLAIQEFHEVVERQPDHVMAWNGLAVAYARIGEHVASAEALEHAKSLAPEDPVTRTHEGLLAAYEQRWQQARTVWQQVVALHPGFAPAERNLQAMQALQETTR